MAATALYGLGTALGLYGGIQNANAQSEQADFQAKQDEFNAQISDIQAKDAIDRGDIAAGNLRNQANQLQGSQRASAAAQGIDVNSGDAAALVEETNKLSTLDILNIKNNATREAFGYQAQASGLRSQAQMTRIAGKNAATGSILTSGANAFSGTGSYIASRIKVPKYSASAGEEP
jgi:hypothetical protein